MYLQSTYALGMDGYFYAGQVYSLAHFGAFKIPDTSPVLFFLRIIYLLFSDPVISNKVGAALISSLFIIPAYLIGKRIGKHSLWGILAAALFAISPSLSYMSIEWLKNLGGLLFFLFFLWYLIRFEEGEQNIGIITGGAFFAVLAFLSHRSTAVLLVLLILVFTFSYIRISLKKKLLFLFILAGLVFLGLFFIRGGLHPTDIARFSGVFSLGPFFPLLSSHFQITVPLQVLLEISFFFLIPYIFLFVRTKKFLFSIKSVWVCLFILFIPFWDLSRLDMGFRLIIVGVPVAILLLIYLLSQKIEIEKYKVDIKSAFFFIPTAIICLCTIFFISNKVYNKKRDLPYSFYQKIIEKIVLPKNSLLICHRGLNLFYTYSTWKDALNYIPEYAVSKDKLWRLSYFVYFHDFQRNITKEVKLGHVKRLIYPYHLIREDAWQKYLHRLPKRINYIHRNWFNPYKKRPLFLKVHQKFFH